MTTQELIRALSLRHLGAQDVQRIEEAMNTDDLETMVAVVDRIVALRLRAARKADHVYTT